MAAIITGAIRTIGTFLGAILLPKFNRTMIMVVSAAVMAISIAALGKYYMSLRSQTYQTFKPKTFHSLYLVAYI